MAASFSQQPAANVHCVLASAAATEDCYWHPLDGIHCVRTAQLDNYCTVDT